MEWRLAQWTTPWNGLWESCPSSCCPSSPTSLLWVGGCQIGSLLFFCFLCLFTLLTWTDWLVSWPIYQCICCFPSSLSPPPPFRVCMHTDTHTYLAPPPPQVTWSVDVLDMSTHAHKHTYTETLFALRRWWYFWSTSKGNNRHLFSCVISWAFCFCFFYSTESHGLA